jgi:hypothetical protein
VEAIQLLAAALKGAAGMMGGEELAAALKPHASGLGGTIEAAAVGAGLKPAQHADAVKAGVAVAEVVKRCVTASRKLGALLGAEHLHTTCKAIATVRVRCCAVGNVVCSSSCWQHCRLRRYRVTAPLRVLMTCFA